MTRKIQWDRATDNWHDAEDRIKSAEAKNASLAAQVAVMANALTILTDGTDATSFEVAQKIGRKTLANLPKEFKNGTSEKD